MSIWNLLDYIIYIPTACSGAYASLFGLTSILKSRQHPQVEKRSSYLVVFPAYSEDNVIIHSIQTFLQQDYDSTLYDVVVIADHMQEATCKILESLPITTLIATYENSSKAKALKLCMEQVQKRHDYVVILDADNLVNPDFLTQLNKYEGTALQCHRMAKNTNTPVALLDACSEEINNQIFRKSHNRLGLASALIGSGMCLSESWFRGHVNQLSTAGEDKELEAMLLAEGENILYLEHIPVYDEKVQSRDSFGTQRKRWIAAQVAACGQMMRHMHWNVNYVDKLIQQMLIPKSMCLCLSLLMTVLTLRTHWIVLTIILGIALSLCIPQKLISVQLFKALLQVPFLVLRMLQNTLHLKGVNKQFLHTGHSR